MNDQDEIEVTDQQGNRLRMTRGEYAEKTFEAARQWWDDLEAMRHFTIQFLQEGFPKQSLEVATRAAELSEGNVRDLYWLAAAKTESGDLQGGAAGFEEIIEDAAYPADIARATAGLARVRARQERPAEAEALFNEAVDTDPDNHNAMMDLYGFLATQSKQDEALAKIKGVAEKLPRASAPHRALAHIAFSTQNPTGIRPAIQMAIERATPQELGELLAEATMLLGQTGQAQEMINLLEPRRGQVDHPIALLNLAQAYVDTGRSAEARTLLTSIRPTSPPQIQQAIDARLAEIK